MMIRTLSITLATVLAVSATTVHAAQIGVNFNHTSASFPLGTLDVAGVPAYQQDHWNNPLTTANSPPAYNWTGGTEISETLSLPGLMDDGGFATSANLSFTNVGTGSTNNNFQPVNSANWTTNNGKLMRNMVFRNNHNRASATISNIPYAEYDLVVYYASAGSGGNRYDENRGSLQVTGQTDREVFPFTSASNGTQWDGTWHEWSAGNVQSDYVVYSGLTLSALTLKMGSFNTALPTTAPPYTPSTNVNRIDEDGPGITGFQIINTAAAAAGTPEPSTLLLAVLGTMGLAVRRRRKRRSSCLQQALS